MNINETKYDVIIIGGGLSGLIAGAYLVKKGKRVILLEQHSSVGGYASGFTRKGYYFDAGIGRNLFGMFQGIWDDLGISKKITFINHKSSFQVNEKTFNYTDLKSAFDGIANLFPEEKEGISQLYQNEIVKIEGFIGSTLKTALPETYSGFKKYFQSLRFYFNVLSIGFSGIKSGIKSFTIITDEILKKYLKEDSPAFAFLSSLKGFDGAPLFYLPTSLIYLISCKYPICGFQMLSDEIAGIITSNKGELITNATVKRIIIDNKKAIGIEYKHKAKSERIFGENIISAIDMKKSFLNLVGEEYLDKDFSELLKSRKMSESGLILYLGVNIPLEKISNYFNGNSELFYIPDLKRKLKDPAKWDSFNPVPAYTLLCSGIHNPKHAPKEKSNLRILLPSVGSEGWMNNWGIKSDRKTAEYREIKKKIIRDILKLLEKVIPDLKNRSLIEVCELATPYTMERYTGNTGGSYTGFTKDISEKHISGGSHGTFFDHYAGLENLYFIGHQTASTSGMSGAMLSAKRIAEKI